MNESMRVLFKEYDSLRGKSIKLCKRPFWDLLVITTADETQRQAYQLQLKDKAERHELPVDLPIHVVTDPPGTRIGNGGSTLIALEFLHNTYRDDIYTKRTLLIHAGGWSQRMPSASILGKIFSAIPQGNPLCQMLDIKLAMYWPLIAKMKPGVLLVCADDLLTYDLGHEMDWSIPESGFTAFAHPSSLTIGQTHGVFVLNDSENIDKTRHVCVTECLEVLQKPSLQRMEDREAVLPGFPPFEFAGGIKLNEKVVYTDSSFYFGIDVMKSLLQLKKKIGTITCEIDAYGDFLQALGERATSDYITLTSNISLMQPNLIDTRFQVFKHLRGSSIHLLIMNCSKFTHIGTTKEYLHHMCDDTQFQEEYALSKDVFNDWTLDDYSDNNKKQKICGEISGCVMHSSLSMASLIHRRSVTEYCHIDIPISVPANTILSSCQYLQIEASSANVTNLVIPEEFFMHTVPILTNGTSYFVTIFMHTFDNVKASCLFEDAMSLSFAGRNIADFCHASELKLKDIVGTDLHVDSQTKASLWNLKLFAAFKSMTSSFEFTLREIQHLTNKEHMSDGRVQPRFSMADLLKVKDVAAMLKYRRQLFEIIKRAKN